MIGVAMCGAYKAAGPLPAFDGLRALLPLSNARETWDLHTLSELCMVECHHVRSRYDGLQFAASVAHPDEPASSLLIKLEMLLRFLQMSLIAIGVAASSSSALAWTECSGLSITRTYSDVNGDFYISTGPGINGRISYAANPAGTKLSVAMAIATQLAGKKATIRYKSDGVACGSAVWTEEIVGVAIEG